jgi:murein DD-endopeptidase MepM/ murein hydrolase activator NlpD
MPPGGPNAASPLVRGWTPCVLVLLVTALAFVAGSTPAAMASRPTPSSAPTPRAVPMPDRSRLPDLWMPVAGPLVRGFDARAGPYGPGHRGIDIAAPVGEMVRAPAPGKVVFAGPVAGTTWVSLLIAPGVLLTLGPVLHPTVTAGQVRARRPVGRVGPGHGASSAGRAGGAAGGATLHLSVRVDGTYIDPLAYLVDRPRARLAPLLSPGGLPTPAAATAG